MKVRFFTIKGKSEFVNIYVRAWNGRKIDQKTNTGLKVKFENWNDNKQQVRAKASAKEKDLINTTLNQLRTHIVNKHNEATIKREFTGKHWLKNCVNVFFGRVSTNEAEKIYFTDWANAYIENPAKHIYKGERLTDRTIQKHKTTLRRLKEFEELQEIKYRFEEIDLNFYNSFLSYCRETQKLANNTIGKYIGDIKKWCKLIELEGLPISPQYKHTNFIVPTNRTRDVYLTDKEINAVFEYDFKQSLRLDNARNLFIIGLRTGLRISDFMRLKNINIQSGFIEIETQKTNEPVIIPLHPQIKAIINRNGGKLPHAISAQKFNEYVKEVCKLAGIDEQTEGAKMNPKTKRKETGIFPKYALISSHTCRRSFASNLYGKLPNMTIMAVTGHRTETQFLKYIKISKKQHAEKLAEHYRQITEKEGFVPVLRVVK